MEDRAILRERAQNIWGSFARKFEPIAQAARLEAMPSQELSRIGGLADAKVEIQTYACAATDPDVYARWGTHPPERRAACSASAAWARNCSRARSRASPRRRSSRWRSRSSCSR